MRTLHGGAPNQPPTEEMPTVVILVQDGLVTAVAGKPQVRVVVCDFDAFDSGDEDALKKLVRIAGADCRLYVWPRPEKPAGDVLTVLRYLKADTTRRKIIWMDPETGCERRQQNEPE